MLKTTLKCISPIDGRYNKDTEVLSMYFSEEGLIRQRVYVELEYLMNLLRVIKVDIEDNEKFIKEMHDLWAELKYEEILKIKEIEKKTNHDVKSVEIYLRDKFDELNYSKYKEYIHFGLTSQDINSVCNMISLKECNTKVMIPRITELLFYVEKIVLKYAEVPMLSRTHGQPASPTSLGKEFDVFRDRIHKQFKKLIDFEYSTKFGGAVGNFNSHVVAYPEVDWPNFADIFINKCFQLQRNKYTTQIDIYDNYSELFDILKRLSTVMLDMTRDIWLYIMLEYFKQKCVDGEVGSSTMPHKINPINFENAEGNLMLAITMLEFMSRKLPVSRLQRDLTDSTVLRNIGTCYGYLLIGIKSLCKGFEKIEPNLEKIKEDLNKNSIVLAEAIQSILRRELVDNSYDIIKEITRNQSFSIEKILIVVEEKIQNHKNKDKIIEEIRGLDVNKYVGTINYKMDYEY